MASTDPFPSVARRARDEKSPLRGLGCPEGGLFRLRAVDRVFNDMGETFNDVVF